MHAKLQLVNNVHFSAQSGSGHTVPIDGPVESGGENLGVRPMELMLMGVGGCASFDVVTILRKARQNIDACVTEVSAHRAETIPQVFESVHLHFTITGNNLNERAVARAISLSVDKYCSASRMLEAGGVKITHDFEIRAQTTQPD